MITEWTDVAPTDMWSAAKANRHYMHTHTTTQQMQVVLVSIEPEDKGIEAEVHTFSSQQFTVVKGRGTAVVGDKRIKLCPHVSFVVPANTRHEIINDSDEKRLVIISVYAPPVHEPNFMVVRRLHDDSY